MATNNSANGSDNLTSCLTWKLDNRTGITGDGTLYPIDFNVCAGGDSGGGRSCSPPLYTVPIDGNYFISGNYKITNIGTLNTLCEMRLVTTAGDYLLWHINTQSFKTTANTMIFAYGCYCYLSAGETATLTIMVDGNTSKNINISSEEGSNQFLSCYILRY